MKNDHPDNDITSSFEYGDTHDAPLHSERSSSDEDGEALLLKYLSGHLGREDQECVHFRISSHPLASKVLSHYMNDVAAMSEETPDARNGLTRLKASIASITEQKHDSVASKRRPSSKHKFTRSQYYYTLFFASVLLLVSVSSVYLVRTNKVSFARSIETSIYTTANAQRSSIILADGSSITLNVGSRIEIPVAYGTQNRTVYLRGEALFSVKNNQNAPFTVVTRQGEARVLGTTFIVRSYNSDTAMTVAVQDGKVALDDNTVVTGGEQASKGVESGSVEVRSLTPGIFSFANGVLVLDEKPLIQALPDLTRWYDASVTLGDISLTSRTIGGEFVAGSIVDFKMLLEAILNVRVERHGKVLTLYPRDK